MWLLAFRNLVRRPLRNGLTISGLAVALAVLAGLSAFGRGYQRALGAEIERMGIQMMLVPLGCPYDAAARVLKGMTLENSLPESALEAVRRHPAVAVAAPLFMAALPRPGEGRADMWIGLDESALALKPWWRVRAGQKWFDSEDAVILGCDAAEIEMRAPGDLFYSPETGRKMRVAGILERSGTSDDSLFFVPLSSAQKMFAQEGRLTAIAIRLRDPALVDQARDGLQQIPGAQVVTLTEMMGTFLNLIGAARTLLFSIALVAVAVSVGSVFNTLLAGLIESTGELAVMRALGASRVQIAGLLGLEALALTGLGTAAGLVLAALAGPLLENLIKRFVPLAPAAPLLTLSLAILLQCAAAGIAVALVAVLYPAWRASRLQPAEALKAE